MFFPCLVNGKFVIIGPQVIAVQETLTDLYDSAEN